MKERLLQFIWQHSLYNPAGLKTLSGEAVTVVQPGIYNTDAGPDFTNARVRIGNTLLAGHIELHVHTGDWLKHNHQHDEAYQNIILHVVYRHDGADAGNAPILELAPHITPEVLTRYEALTHAPQAIPCAGSLPTVKDITKEAWMSRLLAERWEEKLGDWKELLQQSAGDWRNLLYWRMAANFGFKVNATPFLMLAQSIPLNVLAKHKELFQVEALLFGQAGMLAGEFKDEYPNRLKTEYAYLQSKYKLTPLPAHLWKFLRLRPANFPTIRIAQFAALIHQSLHLFSQIVETHTVKEIIPRLDVTASEYWDRHFTFDEEQEASTKKRLGLSSVHNIIINTIAPIQFLYAAEQGTTAMQEKALTLLEAVPPEKNNILTTWQDAGWKAGNAAQSQALIQLYNKYCTPKRCLDCALGHSIMKSAPVTG